MTFTYEGANLSETIENFIKKGNIYTINYLDKSSSSYICYNDNEEQKIKNIMIQQAIERQNKIDMKSLFLSLNCYLIGFGISTGEFMLLLNNGDYFLKSLILGTSILTYKGCNTTINKLIELKKYKMFLELRKNLEEINKGDFLKCVEFDNFYQIPFSIDTLDYYKYSKVKTIYNTYFSKNTDKLKNI